MLTLFVNPRSEGDTVIDSSGIPPFINPKSPTGRHSIVGANPDLHLHAKAPDVFIHSVEAESH